MDNSKYIAKELSWLAFNARVLQEADDPDVPLIEKVRFLGIYSSNQDEFFKVRVADLKRQAILKDKSCAMGPSELLRLVQKAASSYQKYLNIIFAKLKDELSDNNVYLKSELEITDEQRSYIRSYFKLHVLKYINPIIITEGVDLVSFLKDQYTYLVVKMSGDVCNYALIEIPSDIIPRFIRTPSQDDEITLMFLDDVIRIGLDDIFSSLFDYDSIEAYSIKMNREAEYDLSGNMDKSVMENISNALKQRLYAMPVRFAYDKEMPEQIVNFMAEKLHMSPVDSFMPGNRYHNFKDFLSFPSLGKDNFENEPLPPLKSSDFEQASNPFAAIARRDILLYYPYHNFSYFTEVLRVASYDPKVTSIKINIYRVAQNSRVIDSLIDAANNGKLVTVVVELKARFDEANNIKWAKRLTDSGVKVLFGTRTLKIHSKLCLISRKEGDNIVRYAHIGTGNFNEKTAKIYTDFALFTVNAEIAKEVDSVFNCIEYPYNRHIFKHLLVSPINARRNLYALIDREIENARGGKEAFIHLKLNNLVDNQIIDRLYRASEVGVKVRLIVRGMCSLKAQELGLSDNIIATSIVDRFLEHPRVMIFCNNGDNDVFISSFDLMTRNLDYRIEVGTRILDPRLKERIIKIFDLQASDNQKARILDSKLSNNYVINDEPALRSQMAIYDYLQAQEDQDLI